MVGGIVIEVIQSVDSRPDVIWVNAKETVRGYNDEGAIYVEKNDTSLQIKSGDSIWWQGRFAMWTPKDVTDGKCGVDYDIQIPRVGYSGVARPEEENNDNN